MRNPLSDMDLRRSRMPIKSIEEPLAKFQLRRGPGREMMQGKGLGMRKMRKGPQRMPMKRMPMKRMPMKGLQFKRKSSPTW